MTGIRTYLDEWTPPERPESVAFAADPLAAFLRECGAVLSRIADEHDFAASGGAASDRHRGAEAERCRRLATAAGRLLETRR